MFKCNHAKHDKSFPYEVLYLKGKFYSPSGNINIVHSVEEQISSLESQTQKKHVAGVSLI